MKKTIKMRIDGQEIVVSAERDGDTLTLERDGEHVIVELVSDSQIVARPKVSNRLDSVPKQNIPSPAETVSNTSGGIIPAPMTGTIKEIGVAVGDTVSAGQQVLVMEAMKMDIEVAATVAGTVKAIHVKSGENIKEKQPLMNIE